MHIFIDYDGTLIKTKEEDFTKMYFASLAKTMKMDPKYLGSIIMDITKKLIKFQNGNDNIYNQFMSMIVEKTKIPSEKWEKEFTEYYQNEFLQLKNHIVTNDSLIEKLKSSKNKLVFASNPLFPKVAVMERLRFIQMSDKDFEYISYMENSHWLKPNPKFFLEILEKLRLNANDCVMIGDTDFDKSCEKVNIRFIHINEKEEWKKII